MSESSGMPAGAKVVISPDKMRAWVVLPKPAKGGGYSARAIADWLPSQGVVCGASPVLIQQAISSARYDDLLEVARGEQAVAASGGDYVLKIDGKPFTGLRGAPDGSLIYDNLTFLQEAQAGQVLAEIVPPTQAQPGRTVTGEEVPPREGSPGRVLQGSGYEVSDDGRSYRAPGLSHVSMVNDQLVVTPLVKIPSLAAEAGPYKCEGNIIVEGDVTAGASIEAGGSVFVTGRANSCSIAAGNNVLLCGGMFGQNGVAKIKAKGSVWGQFFEMCEIEAGGDICANHLSGCEATAEGRANILGGRGQISGTNLYAKNGVVAGRIGAGNDKTLIAVGMNKDLIDHYAVVNQRFEKLSIDINALQQNIVAHERVNRMKPETTLRTAKWWRGATNR